MAEIQRRKFFDIAKDGESATMVVREWESPGNIGEGTTFGGQLLCHSSFGDFSNTWPNLGRPFREFLAGISFDSFMSKTRGDRADVFDGDATCRRMQRRALRARRQRIWSKEEAREVIDAIIEARDFGVFDCGEQALSVHAWPDSSTGFFQGLHECIEQMPDPQCVGFWSELWPLFLARLASDSEANKPDNRASAEELLYTARKIAANIERQDNRSTAEPIFIVQRKVRVHGFAEGFEEGFEWASSEEGRTASTEELGLIEASPEFDRFTDEVKLDGEAGRQVWRKIGYRDTWEYVTACFTEQGCKDHIEADGHNLGETRIYADGSYRNAEFRAVRNLLVSEFGPSLEGRRLVMPLVYGPSMEVLDRAADGSTTRAELFTREQCKAHAELAFRMICGNNTDTAAMLLRLRGEADVMANVLRDCAAALWDQIDGTDNFECELGLGWLADKANELSRKVKLGSDMTMRDGKWPGNGAKPHERG